MPTSRQQRAAVERALRLGGRDRALLEVVDEEAGEPDGGQAGGSTPSRGPVPAWFRGAAVLVVLMALSVGGAFGLRSDVPAGAVLGTAATTVGADVYRMRLSLQDWRAVLGPGAPVPGLALCHEHLPRRDGEAHRACSGAVDAPGEARGPVAPRTLSVDLDSWFADGTGCEEHRATAEAGPDVAEVRGTMASGARFQASPARGEAGGVFLLVEPPGDQIASFWGIDGDGARATPVYGRDVLPYPRHCLD